MDEPRTKQMQAARDEAASKHATWAHDQFGAYDLMPRTDGFKAGTDWLYDFLLSQKPEFDEKAFWDWLGRFKDSDKPSLSEVARYQHEQTSALVAALQERIEDLEKERSFWKDSFEKLDEAAQDDIYKLEAKISALEADLKHVQWNKDGWQKKSEEHWQRAENLEAKLGEAVQVMTKVMAHGLGHYDDCQSLIDEDATCSCGQETTETLVAEMLNKLAPETKETM